jgi:hypothetical protein
MARPEITGRKMTTSAGAGAETPPICGPRLAFTIAEFAQAHRLSVSMYYKLKAQGLGPIEMIVGSRRYVSFEAAERWRREREAAATENAA